MFEEEFIMKNNCPEAVIKNNIKASFDFKKGCFIFINHRHK